MLFLKMVIHDVGKERVEQEFLCEGRFGDLCPFECKQKAKKFSSRKINAAGVNRFKATSKGIIKCDYVQ